MDIHRITYTGLISHCRLWGLVAETKTAKFCVATHVRKHTASPLQTKYHHLTCLTLPLLLLTVSCFSSVATYKKGSIWRPATSKHILCTYVSCFGTHDHRYIVVHSSIAWWRQWVCYACIYATPGLGLGSCCVHAGAAHPLTSVRDAIGNQTSTAAITRASRSPSDSTGVSLNKLFMWPHRK